MRPGKRTASEELFDQEVPTVVGGAYSCWGTRGEQEFPVAAVITHHKSILE